MARTTAATLAEAEEFIRRQKPFHLRGPGSPTLWALCEPPAFLGELPSRHSEGIENAEYVVMSYCTPIAWVIDGEPVIPDVGYSPTTGQHQYLTAHALGVDFRPARGRDTVQIPRNNSLYGRPRRLRRGGMDGPGDTRNRSIGGTGPGSDAMHARYSEQDDLMDEVWQGKFPAHP